MTEGSLQTLLVGIDAASLSILDSFEDGDVDTLRSLIDAGVSARLKSHVPPWTPSAWPTMYTGVNPGKHGVFSFLQYDGYDWDVVDATCVEAPAIWDLLDHHGRSSVVVNVPVTSPPSDIDGAIVPGFTAPSNPPCQPPGLLAELRHDIGGYRVYGEYECADDPRDDERTEEYRELIRSRGAAFRCLVDRFEPDFGFLQFQQSDTVAHDFPGDRDKLRAVYRAIDEQVDAVLAATDPDAIFVVSDHGIGPYTHGEFRVNEFLAAQGFLTTTYHGRGSPLWVPIWRSEHTDDPPQEEDHGESEYRPSWLEQVSAAAVTTVQTMGLESIARLLVPGHLRSSIPVETSIDFASSTAYMRLPVELGVRLNVAGREPDGVVHPDEYEAVRSNLIDHLRGVTTPDGIPVFASVRPREAVFDGPYVDRAPDIVTVPTRFEVFPASRLAGDLFGPMGESWNPKRYGLFVATGRAVDTSRSIGGVHALDIAPTILASLDTPRSTRMDGTTLPLVTPTDEYHYPDTLDRCRIDSAGNDQVEDRLRSLGYIA